MAFEIKNKQWFESHINPREPGFYSNFGIQKHIKDLLNEYSIQRSLPMLIINEEEEIVGRVNLTKIDSDKKNAYLGYRVGEKFTRCGAAKFAVGQIIYHAIQMNIKTLIALVSTENKASLKVLGYHCFKEIKIHKDYAEVNDVSIDCIEYQYKIS
ncbi:GNAT family N-acetyltransferase [Spartinivicinus ruber]|uniref:GNAT family N-acetyltransferase n=1 Tax=Spartinivicinus ruber TaxID=2683272 RepID=UPI001E456A9F|nr:GNAT family N-acetyltransferase [Spartinivicinus ruber]